ncbi:MAG: S-layer homology domain-containing protein, partial [Lachnospiraceae bacterium]|nr:S-layer homology domain-containing protein [Lachnospiraceae bacterium]
KPLVTVTGTPTGGTMYYALGTNATTAPADNLYTTSIPAKTDAGTYYVWYKVAGDDNHLDTNPLCVKVKIMNTGMFADIEYGTWKYTAAEAVYEKQIMVGKGMVDGKIIFAPDDKVNRSQLVTSIYAMDGKPDVDYVQRFSDVKESDWFAKAVTWASNNEITAGTVDGQFGATGNATREQVAVMLYKYAQYCGYDVTISESTTLDGFADADKVHSWALDAVKWAVERKIISGKGKSPDLRIAPDQSATRIECAAMLNRFSEVCTLAMIPDEILEEPIALPMEDIEESPASIEEPEEDIEDEIEDIIDDKEEEIIDDEEEEVIDNEEEEIIDNEEEEVIDDEEEEVIDDEKEEVIDNRETEGI